MSQPIQYNLIQLQPSQLYISEEKLSRVMQDFDPDRLDAIQPIPIKKLGDEIIFTDGHTRALAAHQHGLTEIPVVWDEDELNWEAYEICVSWCKEQKILSIADLEGRIIDSEAYERLWLKRCQNMRSQLETKRK